MQQEKPPGRRGEMKNKKRKEILTNGEEREKGTERKGGGGFSPRVHTFKVNKK